MQFRIKQQEEMRLEGIQAELAENSTFNGDDAPWTGGAFWGMRGQPRDRQSHSAETIEVALKNKSGIIYNFNYEFFEKGKYPVPAAKAFLTKRTPSKL